jgi:hypothetical protein
MAVARPGVGTPFDAVPVFVASSELRRQTKLAAARVALASEETADAGLPETH